jgi:ankyrin repeat protein
MGAIATAKVLLSRGAAIDPEENATWAGVGPTPLAKACLRKHLDVCRLLVESGADLEKEGNIGTVLHWTVTAGDLEIARYLLSRGASLSCRAPIDGQTPLHRAAGDGNLDMVKLFLDFSADVNVEAGPDLRPNMPEGSGPEGPRPTPLDEAVGSRQREMARFLVSRGARLGIEKQGELQKLLESAGDAAAK